MTYILTRRVLATILFASTAIATHGHAAEMARNGSNVSITGRIRQGDATRFEAETLNLPKATIVLESAGGLLSEAYSIGSMVRDRGYATEILRGSLCGSACVVIWLAGVSRYFDPWALLFVHRAHRAVRPHDPNDPNKDLINEKGNETMTRIMREFGAPQALIDLALNTKADSRQYVSYQQLKDWGLLSDDRTIAKQ